MNDEGGNSEFKYVLFYIIYHMQIMTNGKWLGVLSKRIWTKSHPKSGLICPICAEICTDGLDLRDCLSSLNFTSICTNLNADLIVQARL